MARGFSPAEIRNARLRALVVPAAERERIERRVGPYAAVAYILELQPETEILSGVVHTDAVLPVSHGEGAGRVIGSLSECDGEP